MTDAERVAAYDSCDVFPGRLFILLDNDKKPLPKRWKDAATGRYNGWSASQAQGHLDAARGTVAIIPGRLGFLVVDVDEGTPNELVTLGEPLFALHDGRHLYYSHPGDARYGNKDQRHGKLPGISKFDLRADAGYVKLHDPEYDLDMLVTALDALRDGAVNPALPPRCVTDMYGTRTGATPEPVEWDDRTRYVVRRAMESIDVRRIMSTDPLGFPYAEWSAISMAFHNVSNGCAVLRDEWIAWSRDRWGPHCVYKHSPENLPRKWDDFGNYDGIRNGVGTIYRVARMHSPDFDPEHELAVSQQNDCDIEEYTKLFK